MQVHTKQLQGKYHRSNNDVSNFDSRNSQRRVMRGLVRGGAMRGSAKDGEERIQRGMVQLVASWAGITAKNSKN